MIPDVPTTEHEDSAIDTTDPQTPEPESTEPEPISSQIPISGSMETLQEPLLIGIQKLQSINGHR